MKENGNIKVIEPTDDFKRIHKSIIRNKNIDCLTLGIYSKVSAEMYAAMLKSKE